MMFFQCVVDFCQTKGECPHPGCSISISPNSPTIQWFKEILKERFREYEADYTPLAPKQSGKEVLNITVLNGDATHIPYHASMTMSDVKSQIEKNLGIPPNKQKLLYQDKEVEVQHYFVSKHYSLFTICKIIHTQSSHVKVQLYRTFTLFHENLSRF